MRLAGTIANILYVALQFDLPRFPTGFSLQLFVFLKGKRSSDNYVRT
jgi:hypothetical protein